MLNLSTISQNLLESRDFTILLRSNGNQALRNMRPRLSFRILHEHVLSHSATGAPWYSSFSLKRFIFLENGKNCHSLVFTMLQIHIKIKSLFEYKSVWPSGCIFRSYSCSNLTALSQVRVSKVSNLLVFFLWFWVGRSITGSSLEGIQPPPPPPPSNLESAYCLRAYHY